VSTNLPKKAKIHFIFRTLSILVTIQLRYLGLSYTLPAVIILVSHRAISKTYAFMCGSARLLINN